MVEIYSNSMRPNSILHSSCSKDTASPGVISNYRLSRSLRLCCWSGYDGIQAVWELSHSPQTKNSQEKVILAMEASWEWLCTHLLFDHSNWLVWCPEVTEEVYINSMFKLFSSCQAYFWVTYSVVIFIHGKMFNLDNSWLVSIKREHHCLNMDRVPFSTVKQTTAFLNSSVNGGGLPAASPKCIY